MAGYVIEMSPGTFWVFRRALVSAEAKGDPFPADTALMEVGLWEDVAAKCTFGDKAEVVVVYDRPPRGVIVAAAALAGEVK